MKIKFIIFFLSGILFSCQDKYNKNKSIQGEFPDSQLELNKLNGNWELFQVNDTLFSIEQVYSINYGGKPGIILDIDENKIGGFTGCNNWGTTLNILKNSFILQDPIEKHEQGCPGAWDSKFLNFLKNNKSFTLYEDILKLTSINGETMTFKKTK